MTDLFEAYLSSPLQKSSAGASGTPPLDIGKRYGGSNDEACDLRVVNGAVARRDTAVGAHNVYRAYATCTSTSDFITRLRNVIDALCLPPVSSAFVKSPLRRHRIHHSPQPARLTPLSRRTSTASTGALRSENARRSHAMGLRVPDILIKWLLTSFPSLSHCGGDSLGSPVAPFPTERGASDATRPRRHKSPRGEVGDHSRATSPSPDVTIKEGGSSVDDTEDDEVGSPPCATCAAAPWYIPRDNHIEFPLQLALSAALDAGGTPLFSGNGERRC